MVFKDDIIFPNTLAFGARGGRSWKTGVVRTAGGQTSTNQDWSVPLGRWRVSLENRTQAEVTRIRGFVHMVCGQAFAFRFMAPGEHRITRVPARRITSTTFQMRQRFNVKGELFHIDIKKPRRNDATLVVSFGERVTTNFELNTSTGILTSGESLASGVAVRITGEYHIPVMLGTDIPDLEYFDQGFATWAGIDLFEVPL